MIAVMVREGNVAALILEEDDDRGSFEHIILRLHDRCVGDSLRSGTNKLVEGRRGIRCDHTQRAGLDGRLRVAR